ncbi:hypothetical protein [uncultured Paraglaciecola sp.]|uniref:hypothetical protein n=1 Tax=uncultured Paraglaciecola sp. TaxID=1765024 RepID=UPI00262D08F0|nr:hypothetical protein [uncultured Paraglaciecola sp.]
MKQEHIHAECTANPRRTHVAAFLDKPILLLFDKLGQKRNHVFLSIKQHEWHIRWFVTACVTRVVCVDPVLNKLHRITAVVNFGRCELARVVLEVK